MSLSIPALSNPYLSALMYEAGVFCGQEPHNRRSGGWRMSDAFEFLGSIVKVFSELVEVATQTLLIIRTITCAGQGFFTYSTLVLFALAIAPGIVKLISKWVLSRRINGKHSNHYWHRLHQTEHDYRAMSQSHHKQEVVLFGLKDWVLDHWAEAREASRVAENEASEKRQVWELGTNVVEHGIGDLFHVSEAHTAQTHPVNSATLTFARFSSLSKPYPRPSPSVPSDFTRAPPVRSCLASVDSSGASRSPSRASFTLLHSVKPLEIRKPWRDGLGVETSPSTRRCSTTRQSEITKGWASRPGTLDLRIQTPSDPFSRVSTSPLRLVRRLPLSV